MVTHIYRMSLNFHAVLHFYLK